MTESDDQSSNQNKTLLPLNETKTALPKEEDAKVLAWQLLEEYWSSIYKCHDVLHTDPIAKARAVGLIHGESFHKFPLQLKGIVNAPTGQRAALLDSYVQELPTLIAKDDGNISSQLEQLLASRFIDFISTHPPVNVEDSITQLVSNFVDFTEPKGDSTMKQRVLTILLEKFNKKDPKGPTVRFSNVPDSPFRDMHITRTTLSAKALGHRIREGIHVLRNTQTSDHRPIRGISALIFAGAERIFNKMGIGDHINYYYPNLDSSSDLMEKCGINKERLLTVMWRSTMRSPESLQRYIKHGELPSVGVMVIPAENFYKNLPPPSSTEE